MKMTDEMTVIIIIMRGNNSKNNKNKKQITSIESNKCLFLCLFELV